MPTPAPAVEQSRARFLLWTFALPLILLVAMNAALLLMALSNAIETRYQATYIHDVSRGDLDGLRQRLEALAADEPLVHAVSLEPANPLPERCGEQAVTMAITFHSGLLEERLSEIHAEWKQRLRAAGLGPACTGLRVQGDILSLNGAQWMLPLLLLPLALMVLVFHALSRRGRMPLWINWADWQPRVGVSTAIRLGMGAALVCLVGAFLLAALFDTMGWIPDPPTLPESIALWPLMLLAAFFAPVFEEFVFRAWMLERLSRVMPAVIGLLISTGVFVAFHLPTSVFAWLNLYLVGLLLGLLWLRTRSLVAVSVAHGLYNGCLLVLQWLYIGA